MYNFVEDLRFAFGRKQLINQGFHAVITAAGTAVLGLLLKRFFGDGQSAYTTVLAVFAIWATKEWIEQLYRFVRGEELHVIDSTLDFFVAVGTAILTVSIIF